MKRFATIVLLLSCWHLTTTAHTYVRESALASGKIVKIQVSTTGLYRLSYEQLAAWGLQPNQVRLLGYGGNLIEQDFTQLHYDDVPSIPFYMYTGEDGVFSKGDYILFYAEGPQGWKWDGNTYRRTRNCYADYGCYFVSDEAGEQRLLTMTDTLTAAAPEEVYTYTALQLYEKDKVNLIDIGGTAGGGREWYGESLTKSESKTIPFTWDEVVATRLMTCIVDAASTAGEATQLKVQTGAASSTYYFSAISGHTTANTGSIRITTYPESNSTPVVCSYTASKNASKVYINYIEMHMPCRLQMNGNYLIIRNTDHVGAATLSRYHLTGADAYTEVWNITDPVNAYTCHTTWQDDTLCWLGSNLTPQVFLAVRTLANFAAPASRGKIENQNLHAQLRGQQHVIVTPEEFRAPAEQLRQAHEQQSEEKWYVVSDEEVYNEFSSGTREASAIRWMMKYMWDTSDKNERPQSLLLMGDGSFDNRQLLQSSGQAILPTYQAYNSTNEISAYASDDYFGWLADDAGMKSGQWDDTQAQMDISVGRLPVSTYEQAEQVVGKLITYMQNTSTGNWKQQLCFLADDGDHGDHVESVEMATTALKKQAPEYIQHKIYLDSYEQETTASGERYPQAQSTYNNLLQSGVLLMDFAGHGSPNNICTEMFLTRKQVENMSNTNLGLWALATCNFARFDQKDLSTAEVAVLNPVGGAIGVVSADRTVFVDGNERLNQYFCTNLFQRNNDGQYAYTIGEALRRAKNQMTQSRDNSLPYLLLGDPALRLNYAAPYQIRVAQIPDTIHALDLVKIEGYITHQNNDTVPFNGQLSLSVFDKQQTLATRDNDEPNPDDKKIIYYQDYPNKLFVGQAKVENGMFSLQFRMPKDLRYNIDFGRLTLYATGEDAMGPAEALGYSEAFKVGGSSPQFIYDEEGPQITRIYLNTPLFKNGDVVNATPHFYAELEDENGINTAGSGIGHDLLLTIDNNAKQTYILNSYYTSSDSSYQQGLVSYPMSKLADGNHSLLFRAWDMLNNASSRSLNFTISSDADPALKQLVVYPNPVSQNGELTMAIQHDRPDDRVSMHLTFYDLMGHVVWTTNRRVSSSNTQLTINMADAHIPTGMYIYQLQIQTSTQSSHPLSGRLIVY